MDSIYCRTCGFSDCPSLDGGDCPRWPARVGQQVTVTDGGWTGIVERIDAENRVACIRFPGRPDLPAYALEALTVNDYIPSAGASLLGRAVGHAAFQYGDRASDYGDIITLAVHGRRAAPAVPPASTSRYVTSRARQLITQAEATSLTDPADMAAWMGSATEILRELIRDA